MTFAFIFTQTLTIAGLTLKEAVRRRTLFGALLMGLLVLGLSLIPILIRMRLEHRLAEGRISPEQFALSLSASRSALMSLCLSAIKSLGALFAALLAGGAISGDIERGVLAVILPKPLYRWQLLLGRWIGLNLILVVCTLLWSGIVWASFDAQLNWGGAEKMDMTPLLRAGPLLALYPLVLCTLTLTISAVAPRLLGTTLALTLAAFSWFDGIFNSLATLYDVDVLRWLADFAGLVVPQGYIGWWVEHTVQDVITFPVGRGQIGLSPEFLTDWGRAHLHMAHLDVIYVVCYVIVVFALGVVLFQRRDVN